MTLDRVIALLFIVVSISYGYASFVLMEAALLPFEQNMQFLPNTLPKIMSICGVLIGLVALMPQKKLAIDPGALDTSSIGKTNVLQTLAMIALMVAYALMLRPAGFFISTIGFLVSAGLVLGERRYILLFIITAISTGVIWYVVSELLDIVLRPLPTLLGE